MIHSDFIKNRAKTTSRFGSNKINSKIRLFYSSYTISNF